MRNFLTSVCAAVTLMTGLCTQAAVLTEDFESGSIPAEWNTTGTVTIKKDNGSNRASMGNGATLTSPAITGVTSVAYKHRGSGNNKELVVEASADGGATWTQVGTSKVSSSSSYGSASHAISLGMSTPVMVRFTCKSATIYVDDISINYVDLAVEPTLPPSVTTTSIAGDGATLAITKGDGCGRLVAYTEGTSMDWTPTDGMAYSRVPTTVDDVTIVALGDVTSQTISGLQPGCTYTVGVFEYNGEGETVNYLTTSTGKVVFTTLTVPVLTLPIATIDFKNTKVGTSKSRQVKMNGVYLEPQAGEVTLTLPESSCFAFAGNVNTTSLSYTDATLDGSVEVVFTPADYADYEEVVTVKTGTLTKEITLKGRGADNDNYEYFIAPDGDDTTGDGSLEHPWLNLQKAVNAALPGDVIYCRGGRYHFTWRDSSGKLTVRIKNSGTAEAPISILAYNGEQPIFDFEQQLIDCNRDRSKVGDRGMLITGNYWHIYGIHFTHAADNAIKLEGSHNRIERCEFSHNLDTGIQLGFGHNFSDSGFGSKNDGSYCAYNDIIDCDSHHNCDFDMNYGSDADGFACKMHNGKGNRFIRCRAWRNSDDAWDLYETDYDVVLIECWAWESGNADDHTWVYDYFDKGPGFSGNGNGIKLGGNGSGGSSQGVHYAYNCVAFGCDKSGSTKGFDCNSHKGGHVIVGGLAFDNGYDFMFESGGGANSEFYNNVCFGRQEILVGKESNNALGITPNPGKTFVNNVVTDFSRSDYVSLDEADALAPRGEDGSMPVKFARLKSGSKLVDAGLDIKVPYTDEFPFLHQDVYGNGRDLGPYELKEGEIQSGVQMIMTGDNATVFEVKESGRGREMLLKVSVANTTSVDVSFYTMAGALVDVMSLGELEEGAEYTFPIDKDLAPGVYIFASVINGKRYTAKVLVK